MSYDFKAIQSCSHSFYEFYPLEDDNTIHVPWPALNENTCKVYFNGQPVPRGDYFFRNVKDREVDYTYVIFKAYQRTLSPRYRLGITATREKCPKCNGTGVSVNLAAKAGGVIDILDSAKNEHLYQQFLLFLKTKEGSDPFYPRYGSRLHSLIGEVGSVLGVTAEVQRVYRQWLSVRQAYDRAIGNTQQRYFSITGSSMVADPADPRHAQVKISLSSQDQALVLSV